MRRGKFGSSADRFRPAHKDFVIVASETEKIHDARLLGPLSWLKAKKVHVELNALIKRMTISEPDTTKTGSVAMHITTDNEVSEKSQRIEGYF